MTAPPLGATVVVISVWCVSAHFVHIQQRTTWTQAQTYCRTHYTDLLPLATHHTTQQFKSQVRSHNMSGWIGLYRDPDNNDGWRWSGGDYASFQDWGANPHLEFGYWTVGGWQSASRTEYLSSFYCLKLTVVEDRKRWEEALVSCRQNHMSFTSMNSWTELRLTRTQIQPDRMGERVWIGLRFLRNRWMWVNGEPLWFHAWPNGSGQDRCPVEGRCAALSKEGQWETWDCNHKLTFVCS